MRVLLSLSDWDHTPLSGSAFPDGEKCVWAWVIGNRVAGGSREMTGTAVVVS